MCAINWIINGQFTSGGYDDDYDDGDDDMMAMVTAKTKTMKTITSKTTPTKTTTTKRTTTKTIKSFLLLNFFYISLILLVSGLISAHFKILSGLPYATF